MSGRPRRSAAKRAGDHERSYERSLVFQGTPPTARRFGWAEKAPAAVFPAFPGDDGRAVDGDCHALLESH